MLVLALIIVIIGFMTYFYIKTTKSDVSKECEINDDCVPAGCCHPSSCVSFDKAPVCEDIFCTQVCSGPLDCGAGYCGCINGKCSVINKK